MNAMAIVRAVLVPANTRHPSYGFPEGDTTLAFDGSDEAISMMPINFHR